MELYKFLTGLVHTFEIVGADVDPLRMEPLPGATFSPHDYKVVFKPRK